METKLLADGLSPKSVELAHTVLSGVYRDAMRMELLFRNPVSLAARPRNTTGESVGV